MLEKGRTQEPQNFIKWEETKLKQDVIIIGAGPAGITAAYELSKEKEKFTFFDDDGNGWLKKVRVEEIWNDN